MSYLLLEVIQKMDLSFQIIHSSTSFVLIYTLKTTFINTF